MSKKFYITTPIYYSSGNPHLGHFYTTLCCDVLNKYHKIIKKEDVYFQTGCDEHGQKIEELAKKNNIGEIVYVNKMSKNFETLFKKFKLDYTYFLRTTNNKHKNFVKKMLQKSFDNGDIYLGKYEGYYCIDCENYYEEKELDIKKNCLIHKKKCVKKNEENYFFKLSKYQKFLEKLIDEKNFILPKGKGKEIKNRINEGLKDISISRKKESLKWGIEIPFDKTHICYVWFDALFNYISGLEINNKMDFWPANYHIIGHDILWFHSVYWPCFLKSCGYEMPQKIFAHSLILDKDGHKMSKSLGNVICPYEMEKKYGLEEFKIYLMSFSMKDDIKFDEKNFVNFINNYLNNDFGNLVSRIYSMTEKYFNLEIPKFDKKFSSEKDLKFSKNFENFSEEINLYFKNLEIEKVVEKIFEKIRFVNQYINDVSPWKIKDRKQLGCVINNLISFLYFIKEYLKIFMPEKILKLEKMFNFE